MIATPDRRELGSLRAKFFYGFGSIAFGVKDFGFGTLLFFYYNQVIGLPAVQVSFAIAFVLVFDAFADPIVGQISDSLRTRWGRRHPFMYAAAIPVALSYFFLWIPPTSWSHEALFYYLVVMAMIVRTFITMYEIPSSALVPEMSENYDQRTTFVAFRYFFAVGAAVAMGFVTYKFLLYPDAAHKIAQLNPAGYPRFALASAIIMVTSILISARGTHRYIPFFRMPPERRLTLLQVLREMGHSLAHRQFLILVSAAIFGTMSIGLAATLAIYFNTYFWGLTTSQIGIFALTGAGSAVVSPFIAGPISKWLGKKNGSVFCFFCCVVLMVTPISLRLIGFFPANGTTLLLLILFLERTLTAIMGVGCVILFGSMMADVVDDSALRTGRRSEGLFFASMGFIAKMLSGAGLLLAGVVLRLAHFPDHANPATIDPSIVRHLAEVYLPFIIGFYSVGIVLLSRYRITRELHEDNLRRLGEGIALAIPVSEALAGTPAVELAAESEPLATILSVAAARPAE